MHKKYRHLAFSETLKRSLSLIFIRYFDYVPLRYNCSIIFTEAVASSSLREAKVYVSIFGDHDGSFDEEIIRYLNSKEKFFLKNLSDYYCVRYLPRLKFVLDISARKAQEMDSTLKSMISSRQS